MDSNARFSFTLLGAANSLQLEPLFHRPPAYVPQGGASRRQVHPGFSLMVSSFAGLEAFEFLSQRTGD